MLATPALRPHGPWTARSDTPNRPRQVKLTLDPADGRVLKREGFAGCDWLDQAIGVGVAAHDGRLFLGHQIVSLLTAAGLLLIAVSGGLVWWRRRPDGVLGAPVPAGAPASRRRSWRSWRPWACCCRCSPLGAWLGLRQVGTGG